MRSQANAMGIFASDPLLRSATQYARRLLAQPSIHTARTEAPFESWKSLPNLALLAIKHHQKNGRDFWHWVVCECIDGQACVLDSASDLPAHMRTDFAAMQPKWFITVTRDWKQ